MKTIPNSLLALMCLAACASGGAHAETSTESPAIAACVGGHGEKLETRVYSLPRAGSENNVEVGQTMVSTYRTDLMAGSESYEFLLDQPTKLTGRSYEQEFVVTLPPLKMKIAPGNAYRLSEYTFQYANDSAPRTGITKPDVFLMMSWPSREIIARVKIGFGEERLHAGQATTISTPACTISGPDSFQRELVYSGVAKGVISVLYREFSGNMARPAFTQDLHFDLSEGNEIGYKGARFKVLKANNLGISYQVIKNLD